MSSWRVSRVLLAVVASELVVFSLADLAATDPAPGAAHLSRQLGTFTTAYAVALIVVAARPTRASTILPVAVVLAGGLIVTGAIDALRGTIPLISEARHVPQLVSVALLWKLARPPGRTRPRRTSRRAGRPASTASGNVCQRSATTSGAGS